MLQVATDAAGSTTTTTNTNTTRGMAPRGGVLPVNPEQGNRPVQLQIPAAPPAMPTAPRGNGFQPAPPIGSAVNGGALPARPANNGGQVRIR